MDPLDAEARYHQSTINRTRISNMSSVHLKLELDKGFFASMKGVECEGETILPAWSTNESGESLGAFLSTKCFRRGQNILNA